MLCSGQAGSAHGRQAAQCASGTAPWLSPHLEHKGHEEGEEVRGGGVQPAGIAGAAGHAGQAGNTHVLQGSREAGAQHKWLSRGFTCRAPGQCSQAGHPARLGTPVWTVTYSITTAAVQPDPPGSCAGWSARRASCQRGLACRGERVHECLTGAQSSRLWSEQN